MIQELKKTNTMKKTKTKTKTVTVTMYIGTFTNDDGVFTHETGFQSTFEKADQSLDFGEEFGVYVIEKITFTFDAKKVIADHDLQDWKEEDIEDFVFEKGLFDKEPESIEVVFEQKIERS